jgi:hypothetical protein
MRNRAFLKVVLLGLLTFAFAPGLAAASSQGQNLTEMLAANTAERATAVSGPILVATPASLDFGIVNNGSSGSMSLHLVNAGDVFLNVTSLNFSDPAFHSGAFSGGLSPGAFFDINIIFSPTDGLAHNGTLTFTSDASNPSPSINLSGQGNNCPTLDPIGNKSAAAFTNLSFMVVGSDNTDTVDDVLTYTMTSNLPVGALFNVNTGQFSWTPGAADGGTYSATFSVSDGRCSSADQTISISVTVGNLPPVANAGGPYVGSTGQPVQFSSAGSMDPDAGQTLTYSWAFGDGGTDNSANPAHTYAVPGNYLATLIVTDNGSPALSSVPATAGVTIQTEVVCSVFIKNNVTSIRAHGGGSATFAIQEVLRPLTDVLASSLRMHTDYPNAGSVPEISTTGKGTKIGDLNLDQVADLSMNFASRDINALLSNVPNNTSVNLIITGSFATPTGSVPLRGTITLIAKTGGGGAVTASASPNPFNPETAINYTVNKEGSVSVRVYSIDGRLVRTLVDNQFTTVGSHDVSWNGRDNQGNAVTSGVYFVQSVLNGTDRAVFKISLMK